MKNCIIKLKECYGRLSKSEKIVADYILKNKLTASDLTISELSKKTNVSCSTINRLALNLGYDGYKEFIKSLYLNAHNDEKELNKHIYDVDIDDDFKLPRSFTPINPELVPLRAEKSEDGFRTLSDLGYSSKNESLF